MTNTFGSLVDFTRAKVAKLRADEAAKEPKAAFKRDKSVNELRQQYKPLGYGRLFCCHDKSYFGTCVACRRTLKIAQLNLDKFLKTKGLV